MEKMKLVSGLCTSLTEIHVDLDKQNNKVSVENRKYKQKFYIDKYFVAICTGNSENILVEHPGI